MDYCTSRLSTWWRLRTRREQVLIVVSVCAVFTIIVLAATREQTVSKPQPTEEYESICLTPACVLAASRILENINPEVEPCDNFYKFACGNFIRIRNIPEDVSTLDEVSMLVDTIQTQIRVVLEDPIKPDEPEPFVLAKKLYKACMNTSSIESRGLEPFLKILDSFGGWPVLHGEDWDESNFDWQKTVIELRNRGFIYNHFLLVDVMSDIKNSSKYLMSIGEADLGLKRKFLINGIDDPKVNAYYNYMVDIAVIFGAPRERAAAEMNETLLFEINLANITSPIEEVKNASERYHPTTVAELQTKYPVVNWLEFINALLPAGLTFGEEDVANVKEPSYLKKLPGVLKKTPNRVIANYLMWMTVTKHIEHLTEACVKRGIEFFQIFSVTDQQLLEEPRWQYCATTVKAKFYYAVNALYVQKYFNADAKRNVEDIVNRIKTGFMKTLENVDWMDKNTKMHAAEKVQNITTYVGYPEELLDVSSWDSPYKGIKIDENNFMDSLLNIKKIFTNYDFYKLKKSFKKASWTNSTYERDASGVSVFYSRTDRTINFPAGILQGVFFSADRPQYMNYGPIGSIIGQELIIGFNHQLLEEDGKVQDWWGTTSEVEYINKLQCLIEQYGNYTVKEVNLQVNGINTREENMIENVAIEEAYSAYIKWVEDHGEEPELPGLQYTPRQMFWLAAANARCSKSTPEEMRIDVEEDHYSPDEFRVIGAFSNREDFAKDFQCALGSPMNPQRKCQIF